MAKTDDSGNGIKRVQEFARNFVDKLRGVTGKKKDDDDDKKPAKKPFGLPTIKKR